MKFIPLFLICFLSTSLFASVAPEFGKSVVFDEADGKVQLSQFRGKAVMIMFFQSWCPKCNVWSPKLLGDMEKKHGNNRDVVLMLIKTDGGGVKGAHKYLKGKIDPKKWIIGADKGAKYVKQLMGYDKLWTYAVIDGNGILAQKGKGGMRRVYPDGREIYTIAVLDYQKQFSSSPILPDGKEYDSKLQDIVYQVETMNIKNALSLCKKAQKSKSLKASASELYQDIMKYGEEKAESLNENVKNEENKDRYAAVVSLRDFSAKFKGTDPGKKMTSLLKNLKKEKWFKEEEKAEKYYLKMTKQLSGLKPDQQDKYREKLMSKIASKYPETYFGRLAKGPENGKVDDN